MITFNHIDGVWDRLSAEDQQEHGRWLAQFVERLAAEKGSKLGFTAPPEQRRTGRKTEAGDLRVLEGPALPGPEQEGGYYIIEAETLDEAVEWARRGRWLVGSNEVRQIFSAPD